MSDQVHLGIVLNDTAIRDILSLPLAVRSCSCVVSMPMKELKAAWDKHWNAQITLIIGLVEKCKDKDEALEALTNLLKPEPENE